jgi:PAS domain-containing protein
MVVAGRSCASSRARTARWGPRQQIERLTMPDGRSGIVAPFYDLSKRQKYENALRESEETFRAMFDVSSVGKIEVESSSTRFLRANAAMCEFVGYSDGELLARTVPAITHPDDRDRDRELGRPLVPPRRGFDGLAEHQC